VKWPRRKHADGATGGQEARERAEKRLAQADRDLEQARAETPYYERLGYEARVLLVENGIASKVVAAIRGGNAG